MQNDDRDEQNYESRDYSFPRILLLDVVNGLATLTSDANHTQRRDLIRRMFAAVEGLTWMLRGHIKDISREMDLLTPEIEMAFDELTYSVNLQGKMKMRPNFISITAIVRLIADFAGKICDQDVGDFTNQDWADFQAAIKVRNRITHPKTSRDLEISDQDIELATKSIIWIVALIAQIMESANNSFDEYVSEFSEVYDLLKLSDKQTLDLYHQMKVKLDN